MTGKTGISTVKDTNLSSYQSKLSLIRQGYRNDPFITSMANEFSSSRSKRRSPSIHLGYYLRVLTMEVTFERLLLQLSSNLRPFQVLSIGSGFDTTYFRLSNAGLLNRETCTYFEVDFETVALQKASLLLQHSILTKFSSSSFQDLVQYPDGSFTLGNYAMISGDACKIQSLESKLKALNFDVSLPTVVLLECSLTYNDFESSCRFFDWSLSSLSKDSFIVNYEQIHPEDQFGKIMMSHFASHQCPLKSIHGSPTLKAHRTRFSKSLVVASNLVELMVNYLLETDSQILRENTDRTDVFDEFEELYLKGSHYIVDVLICGRNSSIETESIKMDQMDDELLEEKEKEEEKKAFNSLSIDSVLSSRVFQRFGHTGVVVGARLFVFGGNAKGSHVLNFSDAPLEPPISLSFSFPLIFSKGASDEFGRIYLFGGRESPHRPSNQLLVLSEYESDISVKRLYSSNIAPRWKHSLTYENGHLTLIGGKSKSRIFSDIHVYSIETNSWSHTSDLPHPLHSHSTVFWKGSSIIISGGLEDLTTLNSRIYISETGSRVRPLDIIGSQPLPRFSHTSHVVKNKLLLIGGVSSDFEAGVGVIDLKTRLCVEYSLSWSPASRNLLYHHVSVVHENRVFALGGGGNCFSFGSQINEDLLVISLP